MQELPTRKPNRLKDYDYSLNGAYFVTICSKKRIELFADIVVGVEICRPFMQLTEIGKTINTSIQNICEIYDMVDVDKYVIMPNHVHMIIVIKNDTGGRQIAAPTVSLIVGNMKKFVSINAGFSVWQKSFHDHIIRNQDEYDKISHYIETNQENWEKDCFYNKNKQKQGENQT